MRNPSIILSKQVYGTAMKKEEDALVGGGVFSALRKGERREHELVFR